MGRLEKKLAAWKQQGLINPIQADGIARYEAAQPNSPWMLYSFIALGSTVIGIGVISLVTANWAEIPNMVKLGSALFILLALAGSIFYTQGQGGGLLQETLLALFLLSCMATIGLIGQIYHSNSTLEEALLFWSLITFPATMLSRWRFLPFLWTSIFLIASLLKLWSHSEPYFSNEGSLAGLLMATPFLCALLSTWAGKLPGLTPFASALRHWIMISAGMGIVLADSWSLFDHRLAQKEIVLFLPALLLSLPVMATWMLEKTRSRLQKRLIASASCLYLVMFPVCLHYSHWKSTGAVFSILIVGLASILVGLQNKQRLFTRLTLLIGFRFLLVYFVAIGGLAYTGFGLIFSGLLILGSVAVWHKNRKHIQKWVIGLEK